MADPPLHTLALRVYYEDTDFSGAVYHANYLRFLERGRTEWLRAIGIDQAAAFAMVPPLAFVVRRMAIEFIRPARMDDEISVETRARGARGAVLVLGQRILRGGETLIDAEVTVAALGGRRPTRLPRAILTALRP